MALVPVRDLPTDRNWWKPLGMRASGSHIVTFETRIDATNLLGGPNDYQSEPSFSAGFIRCAAVHVGGMQAVFDACLAHLLPWRRDPHCDHRASWVLAQHALDQTDLSPEILEYAIWLEELGFPEDRPSADEAEVVGFYVGDVLANKRAAVAAHLSQTTDLIADDPTGFRLTPKTIARLTQPTEIYVRSIR